MAVFPAFKRPVQVVLTEIDAAKFRPATGERPADFRHGKVSVPLPTPQKLFINSALKHLEQ
jgi:hypothetical protein